MKRSITAVVFGVLLVLLGFYSYSRATAQFPEIDGEPTLPTTISGIVSDPKGPVAGAVVQVQGTAKQTTTSKNGAFTVHNLNWGKPVVITTWSEGFYVGWVKLDPKSMDWKGMKSIQNLVITMKPLYETDNFMYPGFSFEGVTGSASCGLCHREYKEWQADSHSQAAKNVRFLNLYQGTDAQGRKSPRTVYGSNGAALAPDSSEPYYGAGYKLDYPNRSGNCASCHTPLAGKISNQKNCGWSGCHTDLTAEHSKGVVDQGVSPVDLTGEAGEGITCEFCHKIGDVNIDPKTNLPYPDMPGILSMRLYRPEEGKQLFFGTAIDMNRRVTYSSLETKSEFCAPCHYGVFGGVVGNGTVAGGTLIYNSYGEWKDSPYSDPKTGKTCQDCHMKTLETKVSVFPEKGGIERDYLPLHEHYMPGASDEAFLQDAVTMKSTAQHVGEKLQVEVSIKNDNTGHHIPTDAPMREMILVVEALDASGNPLVLNQGPALPSWSGNYAKQPGKSFAKILKDEWTGEMPTASYWRPVTIVEDTRLAAMATDTTRYSFDLPSGSAAQVKVKLVFRRTFQDLAKQKGWTDPDILMSESTIQVEK